MKKRLFYIAFFALIVISYASAQVTPNVADYSPWASTIVPPSNNINNTYNHNAYQSPIREPFADYQVEQSYGSTRRKGHGSMEEKGLLEDPGDGGSPVGSPLVLLLFAAIAISAKAIQIKRQRKAETD